MAKKRVNNETLPALRLRSDPDPTKLLAELRDLIQSTRAGVAQADNSALVLLDWQVGERIRTEILRTQRAGYGEQIVRRVATQLALEFGQGFAEKNLRRMIQLAEVFPDREIVVTLSRQLGLCYAGEGSGSRVPWPSSWRMAAPHRRHKWSEGSRS
jgi:hypothetical protein